jgi:hypothetical protein
MLTLYMSSKKQIDFHIKEIQIVHSRIVDFFTNIMLLKY